jgi:hypothetical protein
MTAAESRSRLKSDTKILHNTELQHNWHAALLEMQKVAAVQRPATAYLNCVHCKVIADGEFQIFKKRSGKTLYVKLRSVLPGWNESDVPF